MLKTVLVRLSVLALFALIAAVSLRCDEMETVYETDVVMADSSGNFEIPARGYVHFEGTVTSEMMDVPNPNWKHVFLDMDVYISNPDGIPLCIYIMDENNFFSYQAGGIFTALASDTNRLSPADNVWVTTPGNYYWVVDNRNDPAARHAKVYCTIGHYAQVPK